MATNGQYNANAQYNAQYAATGLAENSQLSALSEWSQYADDSGNPYWYSAITGVSTYDVSYTSCVLSKYGLVVHVHIRQAQRNCRALSR